MPRWKLAPITTPHARPGNPHKGYSSTMPPMIPRLYRMGESAYNPYRARTCVIAARMFESPRRIG